MEVKEEGTVFWPLFHQSIQNSYNVYVEANIFVRQVNQCSLNAVKTMIARK